MSALAWEFGTRCHPRHVSRPGEINQPWPEANFEVVLGRITALPRAHSTAEIPEPDRAGSPLQSRTTRRHTPPCAATCNPAAVTPRHFVCPHVFSGERFRSRSTDHQAPYGRVGRGVDVDRSVVCMSSSKPGGEGARAIRPGAPVSSRDQSLRRLRPGPAGPDLGPMSACGVCSVAGEQWRRQYPNGGRLLASSRRRS